jgi:hypothetical protein
MNRFERINSPSVRLARAGNIEVKRDISGLWAVVKSPEALSLELLSAHRTESDAWRQGAQVVSQYFCKVSRFAADNWGGLSLQHQIELLQVFFSTMTVSRPDSAFESASLDQAKNLCLSIGWTVSQGRNARGCKPLWTLNSTAVFHTESEAWHTGSDIIRRRVMACAEIGYVDWIKLSCSDKSTLARKYGN